MRGKKSTLFHILSYYFVISRRQHRSVLAGCFDSPPIRYPRRQRVAFKVIHFLVFLFVEVELSMCDRCSRLLIMFSGFPSRGFGFDVDVKIPDRQGEDFHLRSRLASRLLSFCSTGGWSFGIFSAGGYKVVPAPLYALTRAGCRLRCWCGVFDTPTNSPLARVSQ